MINLLTNLKLALDIGIIFVSLWHVTKVGLIVNHLGVHNSSLLHSVVLECSSNKPAAILHEAEYIVWNAVHLEKLHLEHEDHFSILWLFFKAS